jgi:hypothetical protein
MTLFLSSGTQDFSLSLCIFYILEITVFCHILLFFSALSTSNFQVDLGIVKQLEFNLAAIYDVAFADELSCQLVAKQPIEM